MNLMEIVTSLKDHFEADKAKAELFLEQHLPYLADLADKAAANPVIDAVLGAVHVSPEILSGLAAVITKLEADLAAAEQRAQDAAAAAQPPADPAADQSAQ